MSAIPADRESSPYRDNSRLPDRGIPIYQIAGADTRERDEHASWGTLRSMLAAQHRVTATFRSADGRTLHVRQATQAEPQQRAIYDALGVDPAPGGIKKMIVA